MAAKTNVRKVRSKEHFLERILAANSKWGVKYII